MVKAQGVLLALVGLIDHLINFPVAFQSLELSAWASRLRVCATVVPNSGELACKLQRAKENCNELGRLVKIHDWFESSFVLVLDRSYQAARKLDVNPHAIFQQLSVQKLEKKLQWTLYNKLRVRSSVWVHPEVRFRKKLLRWQLPAPLGIIARRAPRRFKHLSSLVAPRVLAAVFRAVWNGWCTARRFQKDAPCCLCCSASAMDSIEHYAQCPVTNRLRTAFGLRRCFFSLAGLLCLADGMTE